jgi:hypothetical protein
MTGGSTHSVLDIVVVRHFVRGAVLRPSPKLLIVPKCCGCRSKNKSQSKSQNMSQKKSQNRKSVHPTGQNHSTHLGVWYILDAGIFCSSSQRHCDAYGSGTAPPYQLMPLQTTLPCCTFRTSNQIWLPHQVHCAACSACSQAISDMTLS